MSTITKKYIRQDPKFATDGCGNAYKEVFSLETNASGAALNSDQATAIGNGDVVRIGVLPAGMEIHDMLGIVSTAFTALVTAKVGFAYVDGVDSAAVPQSDAYWATAWALNTAGRYVPTVFNKPITLPKDAYLILTTAGAANAKAARLDLVVEGIAHGNP